MMVVMVSGPFRATNPDGTPNGWEIAENIRRAQAAALAIWRMGAACICPHANTGLAFQGAASDAIWLQGDLAILSRCDAVFCLPGWRTSAGALVEYAEAQRRQIPAFEDLRGLSLWIATHG